MHFRRFSHSEHCRFTFPSTSRKRFLAVPLVVESPDKSPECCYLWCRLVCTHFRTLSTGSQVKAQTTEQSASQPASQRSRFLLPPFVRRPTNPERCLDQNITAGGILPKDRHLRKHEAAASTGARFPVTFFTGSLSPGASSAIRNKTRQYYYSFSHCFFRVFSFARCFRVAAPRVMVL